MSRLGRKLILAPYVGGLLAVALVLSQPCGLAFGQQAERWALGASEEIKDNVRQSFFIAARPVWLSRAHANYLEATARFVALKAGFDKLSAWISSLPEPVSASDWTTPAEQAERLRAELAEL
ncbi:MAG: hypothetical protein Q8K93_22920 [Reyranella sp.]|nr:hypothetical protein [Reyranella sp.]